MHKCILVIDDSLSIRNRIKRELESSIPGCEVIVAEDGKQALHEMTQHSFSLVISDVEMPNMDGNQFADKLGSNPLLKNKTIVLFTSNPDAVMETVRKRKNIHVVNKNGAEGVSKLIEIAKDITK